MSNNIDWGKIYDSTNWGVGVNNDISWGITYKDLAGSDDFIITVKTDNAGTSASDQFTIPTSTSGITQAFLYDIETSDGQSITGVTGNHTITFPSAGEYEVRISGSFPYMYFFNGGDKLKMLDIKNFGIYALGSTSQQNAFYGCSNMVISANDIGNFGNVTNFYRTWYNCSSLTSFPLIDTSSGTNFYRAWLNCTSLTSFPLIDTSNGTSFQDAWYGCSSLTSFPLLDTSSGTNFYAAWNGCSSLTSFPLIDTSSGTNFNSTWWLCSSLTSFPLLDTSSGTNFYAAWNGCSSLTSFPLIDTSSGSDFFRTWRGCSSLANYPANAFDTNIATNYTEAFLITNLTTQSIDDILVSLDTSGVNNGTFTQSGGQAPSATGEAAIDSLVGKGWTITVTGGYTPPQLLLDEYPNAAAAYSLRELSTAFVGQPVVRVRRSSDNTEQDFTAAEITDGTLTTFTGANDGFVTTWYDQSGNGVNVLQSSASLQPRLVLNGVIELQNNKPTVFYSNLGGVSERKLLQTAFNNNIPQPTNYFSAASLSTKGTSTLFDTRTGVSNRQYLMEGYNTSDFQMYAGTILFLTTNTDTSMHLFNALFNNTNSKGYIDSVEMVSGDGGAKSQDWGALGGYRNNGNYPARNISEFIIYPSDQSSNRIGIETNINNEYSIY